MTCLRTRVYRGASMLWVVECTCGIWGDWFIWSNAMAYANRHRGVGRRA